jgi:hypothetical protein
MPRATQKPAAKKRATARRTAVPEKTAPPPDPPAGPIAVTYDEEAPVVVPDEPVQPESLGQRITRYLTK